MPNFPSRLIVLAVLAVTATPSPVDAARRACGEPAARTEKVGGLPDDTGEVSGLAASAKHPGVGWFIRDSGQPASLYALRLDRQGAHVREVRVRGARNTDWEDVSYSIGPDGRGRLWIVESTQSGKDPFVYEVIEPNPAKARAAAVLHRYRYSYPDDGMENTEASFIWDGDLVLVTKTNPPRVYRFASLRPGVVNQPVLVGVLQGSKRVSVVRPAPDRRTLVASDHERLTVYRAASGGSREAEHISAFTGKAPARSEVVAPGDNVEAGDFFPAGSCDMVLLSERRHTYRSFAARN